jgi:hypothetical protein
MPCKPLKARWHSARRILRIGIQTICPNATGVNARSVDVLRLFKSRWLHSRPFNQQQFLRLSARNQSERSQSAQRPAAGQPPFPGQESLGVFLP